MQNNTKLETNNSNSWDKQKESFQNQEEDNKIIVDENAESSTVLK